MRTSDNPVGYFGVPPYEGNEESRLYAMMRLMQNLDLPVALRVDLHPTERATTLRDSLPLAEVWAALPALARRAARLRARPGRAELRGPPGLARGARRSST